MSLDQLKDYEPSPPPEVVDFGVPTTIYVGSRLRSQITTWGGTTLLAALAVLFALVPLAFTLTAPPATQAKTGVRLGVYGVATFLILVTFLIIYLVWKYSGTNAYLFYADGLALCRKKKWMIIYWKDVREFCELTLMAYPHLVLKDGEKVDLQESDSFAAALYEKIKTYVPTRKPRFEPAEELVEVESGEVPTEPEEASPVGLLIGGAVLLVGSLFLFSEMTRMERHAGEMEVMWLIAVLYKAGDKWVACGLVAAMGFGVLIGGMNAFLNSQSTAKPRRKLTAELRDDSAE